MAKALIAVQRWGHPQAFENENFRACLEVIVMANDKQLAEHPTFAKHDKPTTNSELSKAAWPLVSFDNSSWRRRQQLRDRPIHGSIHLRNNRGYVALGNCS